MIERKGDIVKNTIKPEVINVNKKNLANVAQYLSMNFGEGNKMKNIQLVGDNSLLQQKAVIKILQPSTIGLNDKHSSMRTINVVKPAESVKRLRNSFNAGEVVKKDTPNISRFEMVKPLK